MQWFNETSQVIRKIAVIGTGYSGIVSASILKRAGYNVKLFDKSSQIGGRLLDQVDIKSHKVEEGWDTFNDNLIRKKEKIETENFQILCDIRNRSEFMGLNQHINLYHKLIEVDLSEKNHKRYLLKFENLQTKKPYLEDFDFIVFATGATTIPKQSDVMNLGLFRGDLVHYSKLEEKVGKLYNKNVTLIGWSKEMLDSAKFLAEQSNSKSIVLIADKLSYGLPPKAKHFLLKAISIRAFNYLLIDTVTSSNKGPKLLYDSLGFLRRMIYNYVQLYVDGYYKKTQTGLKFEDSIEQSIYKGDLWTLEDNILDLMKDKKIRLIKAKIKDYEREGLLVESVEHPDIKHFLYSDVIVYDSGFKPFDLDIFSRNIKDFVENWEQLDLYRSILHPDIDNVAFIGLSDHSDNKSLMIILQALWLQRFLNREIKVNREEMKEQIKTENEERLLFLEKHKIDSIKSNSLSFQQRDELLKDLNLDNFVKTNLLSNLFSETNKQDYDFLLPKNSRF